MEKGGSTYIITNKSHTTLYTGSATDVSARIYEHRNNLIPTAFSARYNLNKLVYYKNFDTIQEARDWEYYIKGKSRKWKMDLITIFNPEWKDLYDDIKDWN